MPEIGVKVRDKIAQTTGEPEIVCGNSDYEIAFDFDSEWSSYEQMTARFVWCDLRTGKMLHTDVLFAGNVVTAPVMYDTAAVAVGIYAGDIHTTTPARIPCARCITDGEPQHVDPPPDVYEQMLEYLEEIAKNSKNAGGSIPVRTSTRLRRPATVGYIEKVTIGG